MEIKTTQNELDQIAKNLVVKDSDNGTVFNINFDFNSSEQEKILATLIAEGYHLYGFKGAGGLEQISNGVPVWFAHDYKNVFGTLNINYKPKYKVYIGHERRIGQNTIIQSDKMSPEIPLGSIVSVDSVGRFSSSSGGPAGKIQFKNERGADTDPIVVGLAALVNGKYELFCAFKSRPQNTINMEPRETVLLFAAKGNMASGSVVAETAAPGCKFPFDSQNQEYPLKMIPVTLGITSVEGGPVVTETESSENIARLLGND